MPQTKITSNSLAPNTILASNIADATITGAKIANNFNISNKNITLPPNSITGAAGGGNLNSNAINGQTLITNVEDNDEHIIWDATDSTLKKVKNYDILPVGSVIQTYADYVWLRAGTSSTEFVTFLTASFTPKRSNSLLLLKMITPYGTTTGHPQVVAFRQLPNTPEYNLLNNITYRNPTETTNIFNTVWPGMVYFQADYSWANTGHQAITEFTDRPNTTQTVVYRWKYRVSSGDAFVGANHWYYANNGVGTGTSGSINYSNRVATPTYVEIREIKQ